MAEHQGTIDRGTAVRIFNLSQTVLENCKELSARLDATDYTRPTPAITVPDSWDVPKVINAVHENLNQMVQQFSYMTENMRQGARATSRTGT
jgi:hypothetical protein